MKSVEDIRQMTEAAGQGHLFREWDVLDADEREELRDCIQGMDFAKHIEAFRRSIQPDEGKDQEVTPATDVMQLKVNDDCSTHAGVAIDDLVIGHDRGVHTTLEINRFGSDTSEQSRSCDHGRWPRNTTWQHTTESILTGCYDVGLPSNKSLFQIHIERVRRIQNLANAQTNTDGGVVHVYLMTSIHTHSATIDFFKAHASFGLDVSQLHFFQQGMMPCFTEKGEIILETRSKVAMSPNGNGGIYAALEDSGSLADMQSRGVECVDCFSVDNLLAKSADPLFIGYCWESNASCGPPYRCCVRIPKCRTSLGARVVAKAYPEEKVGVFVRRGDCSQVVEYSELSTEMAYRTEENSSQLQFNWANICMHYFTTDFLRTIATETPLQYHTARKTIPSCRSTVQGIKLERFIFDAFPLSDAVVLMEVRRDEDYAPVKNAPGSAVDSPDTARTALMHLHKTWVERAGGFVSDRTLVEVSPLLSYEGEGLGESCDGKDFTAESILHLEAA